MLEFKNVSFKYDEDNYTIIKDLSFQVERGEFVSLLGPSGCGKSTIFKLINKLLKPDAGDIYVNGKNTTELKNYCGYMPQSDMLFPWRSVAQNIRLPLEIQGGMEKSEMDARVAEALANVGLSGWGDKSPSELSGGMRQRAAFARTVLTGSDLLLLDEPFSALDYITRISMREWLLKQWEHEKKTILFITHDVEEAIYLSSRILAIERAPITHLTSIDVPLNYPRSRRSLSESYAVDLKERLIEMLGGDKT